MPPGLDRKSRRQGSRRLRLAEGRFLSDAVDALTLGRVEGLESQAHLLANGGAEEAADRMCLPAGSRHQLRERSALRPADQGEHRSLLAAVARHVRCGGRRGPAAAPALVRRTHGRLCRNGGLQALDGCPDTRDSHRPALEALHGLAARQRVPDGGQSRYGPAFGQSGQFLLTVERLAAVLCFLRRAECRDVIAGVNRVRLHGVLAPSAVLAAVMTYMARKGGLSKRIPQ